MCLGPDVLRAMRSSELCFMLRVNVLVSVGPLIAAAMMARVEFLPAPRPCAALGSDVVEIAATPSHADLPVSVTDDSRLATVRVAISETGPLTLR
jgi:hypothetical protein